MTNDQQTPFVVVLDPGHGGTTKIGGSSPNNARGPNGLLEKDLTLDLATRTAGLLSRSVHVILTRTADVNLSLSDRAAVARNNSADIFVSIHLNGFHDPNVDGTEVWVARAAAANSVDLAREVLSALLPVTQVPGRGVRRSDMGVLLPARLAGRTAACLAEIAFLTNPNQAARLAADGYRQQIAQALAAAISARVRVPATVGAPGPSAPPGSQSLGLAGFVIERLAQYFRNATSPDIPLDPGVGGLCLDESALQIGDIIVSTTPHLSSRGIRFGTGSQVSHAKLYIGASQVVEAVGEGVVLRSLADSLGDDSVAVAFRYPGITQQQQLMVRDFAGQQIGRPYNYLGIVRQAMFQVESSNCDVLPDDLRQACRRWVGRILLSPGNTGTFFCSQLVLAAYANAGIVLSDNPPSWASPQDIVEIALSRHLAYVGHLKAPPAASQSLALAEPGPIAMNGELERRRLAAGIGGYGAGAPRPLTAAFDTITLAYGVAGARITDGFYRDRTEKQAVTGQSAGRAKHLGIDVSTSNAHGGGADDPRRGLPVYAAISRTIDIANLNAVRASRNDEHLDGLGISGQGTATLQNAVVLRQPWATQDDSAYGGVVGLACRYGFTRPDNTVGTFTLYIEYLHLITTDFPPKDGQGNVISADTWAATGKGSGFGPRIQNMARLSADDLTGGDPILVGYLGATQFPHVHIQAAFGDGEQRYLRTPRFDPSVMLRASATTTQAWAFGLPALALRDQSFQYDVPGTIAALKQPTPMACWATVATMLVSWRDRRDQESYPISTVCDMAGPTFRSYFDRDTGLPNADKPTFLQRVGLKDEPPANYTPDAYLSMLRAYGPLWVTADVGSPGNVAVHARVMTGIYGDGSADNTFVWLIDPADGQRHNETFRHFAQTFEQMARDVGAAEPLWVQIVHNQAPAQAQGYSTPVWQRQGADTYRAEALAPAAAGGGTTPAWASTAFARGVDFSGLDITDWTKVAAETVKVLDGAGAVLRSDPLGFVIMQATAGATAVTPHFVTNWAGAHTVDIVRGAYHWFVPTLPPLAQAAHFAATVGTMTRGDLPPIIDLEWWSHDTAADRAWLSVPANRRLYVDNVKTWISEVKSRLSQTEVIIYTSQSFWFDLGNPTGLIGNPLWVANYRRAAGPLLPAGWRDWYMWQYKGYPDSRHADQHIPAIGWCDLNVFTDTLSNLRASVGLV